MACMVVFLEYATAMVPLFIAFKSQNTLDHCAVNIGFVFILAIAEKSLKVLTVPVR